MMMRTLPLAIVLVVTILTIALLYPRATAQAAKPNAPVNELATCVEPAQAFDDKSAEQWRAEGPEGLARLIEKMQPQIEQYRSEFFSRVRKTNPEIAAEHDAIQANMKLLDQVAQQRDAYAAGLYWYTDLAAAVEEAQRTGKPILSLRMLGRLCDEYSCANSRFFRTALYADESVSKLMREAFVLHWKSVRPVPVITIDMGDGRTIKRTITGNSAHYVLDPNGRVVDCLPGLYASGMFERLIKAAGDIAGQLHNADDKQFAAVVAASHKQDALRLDGAWARHMRAAEDPKPKRFQATEQLSKRNNPPNAREAGRVAFASKYRLIEMPLVDAVLPEGAPTAREAEHDEALWRRVARSYAQDARMDAGSRSLIAAKAPKPTTSQAFSRTVSKTLVESPLARMVRNFQNAVAIDTARNEHLLRRQLHDWFAQAEAPLDLDLLNRRVYAELFLTPDSDPWLGLVPADAYSALDGGGLIGIKGQD